MVESDELSEEEEEEEDRDDEQRFGLASTILSNCNFVIWRGGGGEGGEGAEAGAGGRAVDLYSLLFRGRSEVVAVMVMVAVAVLL